MSRGDFDFESRIPALLIAHAKSRGVDVAPFIEKYNLPKDALGQQLGKVNITVPTSTLAGLADDLAAELKDEHLGLSLSAWLPKGVYGVAEFLTRAGPTMRTSFENMKRFSAILSPGQTFHFGEFETEARFEHSTPQKPGAIGRHLQEYTSAVILKTYILMTGGVGPTRAWFTHPRPAAMNFERLVEALHTSNITFNEATNGFGVDLEALPKEVVGGDAALYAFLEEHAVTALASRPKSDDLVDKLRHAIREALKQGEPNIERLATRLNMSGRTLQRRLADAKTSFQEVLDLVRFDLARQYLKDVRLDLSQIAYLLGYSELRAFDRAFRRWANDTSPGEWRSQG
ncbi:MAG: helix-turn-helix domain-containing protein [Archangium sp.]